MSRHHTPTKFRTVRCLATGKVTTQSSNKTKRLLKLGGYEEVFAGGFTAVEAPRSRVWRRIGIGAASVLAVLAIFVWLRVLYLI